MTDRSVVVANAGSGKTYLLANRIVRWMLEERRRTGNASPERVLAITFTRKAAGEILERVLRHLARGAVDRASRDEFADPSQVGRWDATDYAAVLEELVHAMHRVSVSTIDGFLVQLAGAFGPELGLPEDMKLVVLQGAGINVDRGAEEAVLAMKELPGHLLLVIGGGDAWPVLQRLVAEHGLQERVRLLGRMPYDRMMAHTRHALVGLTLDKDTNLNYRFSLPNKLFDYLHAGVPVVATDLPEVAAIVREHACGLVIPAPDPAIIAVAVQRLTADPARHEPLRQRAIFAARSLDGEREKEVLKAFLASLG